MKLYYTSQVVFVISRHQIGELVLVIFWTVSLILHKIRKLGQKFVMWIHWNKHSSWKAYLACFCMIFSPDCWQKFVSMLHLLCLSRFIAFCVTFNGLWCWTQRCGLLSRIHLKVMDQSWHTGPNEFVLQLEVVFVVCWLETGKLVQVALCAVSLILLKLHKTSS